MGKKKVNFANCEFLKKSTWTSKEHGKCGLKILWVGPGSVFRHQLQKTIMPKWVSVCVSAYLKALGIVLDSTMMTQFQFF